MKYRMIERSSLFFWIAILKKVFGRSQKNLKTTILAFNEGLG
jgi:hypothetical protein